MDHHHLFDNNDKDDRPLPNIKVLIHPSIGQKVKVDKDWWKVDLERKQRRIQRHKEKEEKEKEPQENKRKLTKAQKTIRIANETVA